uniref:Endonuclease III homolog n=1 Tax=Blastobotrys adeninivorans TaxID=409370 RepID=A0A060TC13_BLAAD
MRRSARLAKRVRTVSPVRIEYDDVKRIKQENTGQVEIKQENEITVDTEHHVKQEVKEEIKQEVKQEDSPPDVGPPNWRIVYNHVKEMRKRVEAPVDTMGCERLPQKINVSPKVFRYQLLIALMLSSQTKDTTNAIAMANLRENLPGGLNVDSILATDEKTLDKLIFPVGFHSRKAGYIKKTTQILRDNYDDDVPATIEEMVALPGVGPKMAHLLMHRAWNKVEGIGVDVHVHRLAGLWKWTKNAKTPEHTRMQLEEWLPRDLWVEINPTLVGFGQTICIPARPRCDECTLSRTGLCPGDKNKRKKN